METKKKAQQLKNNLPTTRKITKPKKEPTKLNWYLMNAQGKVLGKLAAKAASLLLGKNDPTKKSYEIPQGRVIVINAAKIAVSGKKEEDKKYYRYSGYPSGLKEKTLRQLRASKPEEIINHAVFGMLPKNRLGRVLHKHLYVYPGSTHPHEAQKLETLEV